MFCLLPLFLLHLLPFSYLTLLPFISPTPSYLLPLTSSLYPLILPSSLPLFLLIVLLFPFCTYLYLVLRTLAYLHTFYNFWIAGHFSNTLATLKQHFNIQHFSQDKQTLSTTTCGHYHCHCYYCYCYCYCDYYCQVTAPGCATNILDLILDLDLDLAILDRSCHLTI